MLFFLLLAAAILGDFVNYSVGHALGNKVFSGPERWWLNRQHFNKAHDFYVKHGGKTIVLARFMPIVRTFAPFVAGVSAMPYHRFVVFNVVGAVAWVGGFVYAGYFFGNMPAIQKNFHVVILAIIVISFAPVGIEMLKLWWAGRKSS